MLSNRTITNGAVHYTKGAATFTVMVNIFSFEFFLSWINDHSFTRSFFEKFQKKIEKFIFQYFKIFSRVVFYFDSEKVVCLFLTKNFGRKIKNENLNLKDFKIMKSKFFDFFLIFLQFFEFLNF